MTERLVTCECHVEGIHLTRFKDDPDLYLSMWEARYYNGKPDWRTRLRHIWRIIRTGRPFDDELVLGPEATRQVLGFLLDAPKDAHIYWTKASGTAPQYVWTPSADA